MYLHLHLFLDDNGCADDDGNSIANGGDPCPLYQHLRLISKLPRSLFLPRFLSSLSRCLSNISLETNSQKILKRTICKISPRCFCNCFLAFFLFLAQSIYELPVKRIYVDQIQGEEHFHAEKFRKFILTPEILILMTDNSVDLCQNPISVLVHT